MQRMDALLTFAISLSIRVTILIIAVRVTKKMLYLVAIQRRIIILTLVAVAHDGFEIRQIQILFEVTRETNLIGFNSHTSQHC